MYDLRQSNPEHYRGVHRKFQDAFEKLKRNALKRIVLTPFMTNKKAVSIASFHSRPNSKNLVGMTKTIAFETASVECINTLHDYIDFKSLSVTSKARFTS